MMRPKTPEVELAPIGMEVKRTTGEVMPDVISRIRIADNDAVAKDCGRFAKGVPGRWVCLDCQVKFDLNDHNAPDLHVKEVPKGPHRFTWICFHCAHAVRPEFGPS